MLEVKPVIKMRHNKKENAICCSCQSTRNNSLGMFDLCIGDNLMTICDLCNSKLFSKVLSADCYINSKTKSQQDLSIIRKRNIKSDKYYKV